MEGQIAVLGVYQTHKELQAKRLTGKPTLLRRVRGEGGANKEIWHGLVNWNNAFKY